MNDISTKEILPHLKTDPDVDAFWIELNGIKIFYIFRPLSIEARFYDKKYTLIKHLLVFG